MQPESADTIPREVRPPRKRRARSVIGVVLAIALPVAAIIGGIQLLKHITDPERQFRKVAEAFAERRNVHVVVKRIRGDRGWVSGFET